METERVPFALGKGRALVKPRMDEEIVSGEIRFHSCARALKVALAFCRRQSSSNAVTAPIAVHFLLHSQRGKSNL